MPFCKRTVVILGCFLTAGLLVIVGCGKKGPPAAPEGVAVSGKVLLPNNTPLNSGTVVLRPVSGLHGATGAIQSGGTFTLTDSAGRNAVVPGKYQVYIKLPPQTDEGIQKMINTRYLDAESGDSDIVVEITGPTSDLTIKLKS